MNNISKTDCAIAAAHYETRPQFRHGDKKAYARAREMGWLAEICSHMARKKSPRGGWTKETCAEVALSFRTRTEFWLGRSGCYTQACRYGWIDDICGHMQRQGNSTDRWIYVIKAIDKKVAYVGLSWNVKDRMRGHRSKGKISQLLSAPHVVETISGPHAAADASAAEKLVMGEMISSGWTLLNAAAGGALGFGRRIWTRDRCAEEAKKYTTLWDFMRGSPVCYSTSCAMRWLDEIITHLSRSILPPNYWTKDRCAEAAAQCGTRSEFRIKFDIARQIAQRRGWMDEICAHMHITKRPNGYWNLERCKEAALSFETRSKFVKGCAAGYDSAHRQGWLDIVCAHMNRKEIPHVETAR